MTIDWGVVATIATPVITLFLGIWVNRVFENRPVLISYFNHVSVFHSTFGDGQPLQVNNHSVVLRNAGRIREIRVRHHFLQGRGQVSQSSKILDCET